MFYNDRQQYEKILAEAKGEESVKTNQEKFMEWLSGRVSSTLLSDYYLALSDVERIAQERGIISGSMYDITEASDVARIQTALESPRVKAGRSKSDLRKMTVAVQFLLSYVKTKKPVKIISVGTPLTTEKRNVTRPVAAMPTTSKYVAGKDPVLDFLREKGVEYIDHRDRSGCLWIIGGMEIRGIIGTLRKAGVRIAYKAEGGTSTKGRPAWWTTADTTKIHLESGVESRNQPEERVKDSTPAPTSKEREADSQQGQDGKNAFVEWMKARATESGTVAVCRWAVTKTGKYAVEAGILEGSIYDVIDVEELDQIWKRLNHDPVFLEFKRHSVAEYAFRQYRLFRQEAAPSNLRESRIENHIDERNVTIKRPEIDREEEKPQVQESGMSPAAERYAAIVRDNFENGFRPNSSIDKNRFKQFYEERYGTEPDQNIEMIISILRKVGTWQDDRIFVRDNSKQSDVLGTILTDVGNAFEGGATCVYYTEVYEKYQESLNTELQIYTPAVLGEQMIIASHRTYRGAAQYCYLPGRTPSADIDVHRLMCRSQVPLNYEKIHQELWYIPLDIIRRSLVQADDIVNVAQETYFYVGNFPVSEEELRDIEDLIRGELQQRSYVTDGELRKLIQERYPAIAINTEEFTTYGIRNCLEKRLKKHFSFNGPIISAVDHKLSTSQVFVEFSQSHEVMTLNELKEFAKDISKGGVIYWDSVMRVMTRISAEEFVPKKNVAFDVGATDAVLDELFEGDYIPLKKFKLFLHYPPIGVQWNTFVLESYVYNSSQKFTLLHAGFGETDCCGAVVRRNTSIKEFSDLVRDILAHSDVWETKEDALSLLVDEGYLQKKQFAQLDEILPQAKVQREKLHAGAKR